MYFYNMLTFFRRDQEYQFLNSIYYMGSSVHVPIICCLISIYFIHKVSDVKLIRSSLNSILRKSYSKDLNRISTA